MLGLIYALLLTLSIRTSQNLIYLFLCDRYKKIIHVLCKPYLLAFNRSTSHFGTFHTAREIFIFINLVRSHFSRGKLYAKTAISLIYLCESNKILHIAKQYVHNVLVLHTYNLLRTVQKKSAHLFALITSVLNVGQKTTCFRNIVDTLRIPKW